MSYTRTTKYRVLREAVTFPSGSGELVHAREGDIITGYPPVSARHDVRDGVLELVRQEDRKEDDE